jgi:hypothetical protein
MSNSIFRKMGRNLKYNLNKKNAKDALWASAGAVLYALFPTALQGWGKMNMEGWKGWTTGFVTSNLIGAALNKPSMMFGATAAAATHILYVKGNKIINDVFGSPIFRFGSETLNDMYLENLTPSQYYWEKLNDAANDNFEIITLPTGEQVRAFKGVTPDEMPEVAQLPPAQETTNYVSDDAPIVENMKPSYIDDFEQQVANGLFVN